MKQHRFDESFNEIQEAVVELYSESYMEDHLKVGDWIMQKQRSDYDNSYGIVVDVLKNGGYKALVVGGWSSKPALKSTKGWDPKPVKISKGDIPSKWLKKLETRASKLGIVYESIMNQSTQEKMLKYEHPARRKVLKDILNLSNDAITSLTGEKRSVVIDSIHEVFYDHAINSGINYSDWKDAWKEFLDDFKVKYDNKGVVIDKRDLNRI